MKAGKESSKLRLRVGKSLELKQEIEISRRFPPVKSGWILKLLLTKELFDKYAVPMMMISLIIFLKGNSIDKVQKL